MRKWLWLVAVAFLVIFAGCGGGGGGGSGVSVGESGGGELEGTTYLGAAGVGDFVRITVAPDNSSLTYEISGYVFGHRTGTLSMEPYAGKSHFYKLYNGTEHVADMFLSGNMAFFGLDLGGGNYTVLAGLKKVKDTLTAADVNGTYNFVYISSEKTGIAFYQIDIYENGTYSVKEFSDPTYNETGCWRLSDSGDYLLAMANATDCTNLTEGNEDYRIVVKPGTRRGFVVDYADGFGIGIGLESYNMTEVLTGMNCTAEYSWWEIITQEGGWGNATLTYNATSGNFTLVYSERYSNGTLSENGTGSVKPDAVDDSTSAEGMAFVSTDNGSGVVFMDPVDGYFIEVFDPAVKRIYYHIGHLSCTNGTFITPY